MCLLFCIKCVLYSQSLLDEPNPNSPANSQAAQLYQENKREYEKRVTAIVEQSWVDVWASLTLRCLLSIIPSSCHYNSLFFYLILNKTREKKTAIFEELTHHPEKPGITTAQRATKPDWTLTLPTREENNWGKLDFFFLLGLLVINFTFCIAWCEISYF